MRRCYPFVFSLIFSLMSVQAFAEAGTSMATPAPSGTAAPGSPLLDEPQESVPAASPTPAGAPVAPKEFSYDHLKGSGAFGIGYGNLGTALSFRKWISDDTALELLVSGNIVTNNQADFSGSYQLLPNYNWSLGLQMKNNLAGPENNIYLQLVTALTFSQTHTVTESLTSSANPPYLTAYERSIADADVINAFVGPGFEAFLPFWKNLSIEGNAGMNFSATWSSNDQDYNPALTSTRNYSSAGWSLAAGTKLNAFSIVNAYIHFYFE